MIKVPRLLIVLVTSLLAAALFANTIGAKTDAFFTAATQGDTDAIKNLLAGGSNVNAKDAVGRSRR